MKQIGVSSYQLLLSTLAVSVLSIVLAAFPIHAHADVISTNTIQAIPPGGNSCPQLPAGTFTPYVYNNGGLDSFEFTVPDASYVAVAGSVGNTPVSFQFMTRHVDASGNLRIHVDIYSTSINGGLPLQVVLMSAHGAGQPVCISIVSMTIGSDTPSINYPTVRQTPVTTTPITPALPSSSNTSGNSSNSTGVSIGNTNPTTSSTTMGSGTATSVVSSMTNPLKNICTSQTGAYRLWLILLVAFALIVGGLLWAEFPMTWSWAQTPERIATIILVLLLLLLGFWYFSVACRAALWMPLVAFLIAILGLLAAFWNHPRVTQLLLIQDSNL